MKELGVSDPSLSAAMSSDWAWNCRTIKRFFTDIVFCKTSTIPLTSVLCGAQFQFSYWIQRPDRKESSKSCGWYAITGIHPEGSVATDWQRTKLHPRSKE